MRSYASAYKMCVPTLPRRRNRTAQSRRAGPPDHRLPNQPPSEMLPVLPERGSVVTFEVAEQKQCEVLLMAKIEEHPLRVEVEEV